MSVERNAAGYRRRGVWLPRRRSQTYQGVEALSVDGHRLRFDDELGVYVVQDLTDHYYLAGWFYRRSNVGWEISRSLEGTWSPVDASNLPSGLRRAPTP